MEITKEYLVQQQAALLREKHRCEGAIDYLQTLIEYTEAPEEEAITVDEFTEMVNGSVPG